MRAPSITPRQSIAIGVRSIAYGAYILLAAIPIAQIILRQFSIGILDIDRYLTHVLLLIGFAGGMVAAHEGRHLAIGSAEMLSESVRAKTDVIWRVIALTTLGTLSIGSIEFITIAFTIDDRIGVIPTQLVLIIIALGYLVMYVHYARQLTTHRPILIGISIILAVWISWGSLANMAILLPSPPMFLDKMLPFHGAFFDILRIPLILSIIAAAFIGLPLFIVLASIAAILYASTGIPASLLVNEGYNMLTNQAIPAIPLFTLAGYILSQSNASERLIRFFRQILGWLPGSLIVTAVVASAFFTSFSGASGVTILALGGLLFPLLSSTGNYGRGFSRGLLTSTSNIGLLFPPSLAIILYGTIAQINIIHIFLGALLPGALMLIAFCCSGILIPTGKSAATQTPYRFNARELLRALRASILELLMPIVVLVALFSGLATLVESAAIAVLYALIVEGVIKREISARSLIGAIKNCLIIIGGVLMILAAARGLAWFIIDAQIPILLSEWVMTHISSRFLFLIILNLLLLLTGCFMDIFSAILIVAPLVIPLGNIFDIHPVHLAIIFLANLGVGFITPPVGIDLFLSSYRFERPLTKIYRNVLPFFLLEFAIVLIITYVPWISTALLRLSETAGGY